MLWSMGKFFLLKGKWNEVYFKTIINCVRTRLQQRKCRSDWEIYQTRISSLTLKGGITIKGEVSEQLKKSTQATSRF
jgi:hypothetical protein